MLNVRPENGRTRDGRSPELRERFGLRQSKGVDGLSVPHLIRLDSHLGPSVAFLIAERFPKPRLFHGLSLDTRCTV